MKRHVNFESKQIFRSTEKINETFLMVNKVSQTSDSEWPPIQSNNSVTSDFNLSGIVFISIHYTFRN